MTLVRRGRPLGEIAQRMLLQVRAAPMTTSQLARELQVNVRVAKNTVHRLVEAGYVQYGTTVPGAHLRPARMVQPVAPSAPDDALHDALAGWRR